MGKVIEFLHVPRVANTHPHGEHFKGTNRDCDHERLTFTKKLVECRSCGHQWKDYGTGGKR